MARKESTRALPVTNYTVRLGARGRMVLPAALRRMLRLNDGARLIVTVGPDRTVRLRTIADVVAGCAGLDAHLVKPGVRWSDELIRERRREAARENMR